MSDILWQIEYEEIVDNYPGAMSREEAEQRMRSLGFDPREIKEQLDELESYDD